MPYSGSSQEVPDRPLLSRERLALAVILALAAITVATCSACGTLGFSRRSAVEQHNAGIRISTVCEVDGVAVTAGGGSGVIVSSRKMLTAMHVVDCALGKPKITVDAGDGDGPKEARVDVLMPQRDIARIELLDEEKDFDSSLVTSVEIGPVPQIGDRVCEVSAVPRWTYRCGIVQAPKQAGRYHVDMFTEFGNSGSGVYRDGELVGLTVTAGFCQGMHTCVGGITPLEGLEWLIP